MNCKHCESRDFDAERRKVLFVSSLLYYCRRCDRRRLSGSMVAASLIAYALGFALFVGAVYSALTGMAFLSPARFAVNVALAAVGMFVAVVLFLSASLVLFSPDRRRAREVLRRTSG